ncbi:MAG: DUF4139 domain-containing protein [Alphaproteobacteria bacterium]|nr:DUF4139 domain-containing protein [Alphaproteobacteria bacterium]
MIKFLSPFVACMATIVGLGSVAYADNVSLTIYSSNQPGAINPDQYRPVAGQNNIFIGSAVPGYAMVRQTHSFALKAGTSRIDFDGVAALLDPTTVTFKSLTDPLGTHVVSQNYLFDLVSQEALLNRFLGKDITIEQHNGNSTSTHSGQLLTSNFGTTILKTKDGIYSTNNVTSTSFKELPEGLRIKPTLEWDIYTKKQGNHDSVIAYQTQGITWWTDYNITLTKEGKDGQDMIDIAPWVSILNQTGTSFTNAEIKLMAGDINRQQEPRRIMYKAMAMERDAGAIPAAPPGFAEKSFFEYHLYTLGRPETITHNATKQIALFTPITNIPAKRQYVLKTQEGNKVGVYLQITNNEKSGLGKPLPAGRVRISKQDGKSMELIGEDTIDHTPKDEELKLKLGNAFDIVAERKVMATRENNEHKWREDDIQVELKNRKKDAITVLVDEPVSGSNVQILKPSHKPVNKGNSLYEFAVPLAAGSASKLSYTLRTQW